MSWTHLVATSFKDKFGSVSDEPVLDEPVLDESVMDNQSASATAQPLRVTRA